MIDYQRFLNKEQYKIVTQAEGPCLVLAGAGSGKTRTLVFRTAYLIERGIAPENILLVTFTNKAAKEMLSRVEKLLNFQPKLWGGTFHHLANLILRKHARQLGYQPNFNILDETDSLSLIKKIIQDISVANSLLPKPATIQSIISFSYNTNQEVAQIAEERYGLPENIAQKVVQIEQEYARKKKAANLMDFDDLLINWLALLENFVEIKNKYSQQFQYILVDEYQDTNILQAKIIKHLSSYHQNVLVVGDDSQSIYGFRAAQIANILNFPKIFPKTKIFTIVINYRSTPQILELANEIISHNQQQYPKELRAVKKDGYMPLLVLARDSFQQAILIIERIKELVQQSVSLSEIAVFFRAVYQSVELQMELSRQKIPYVVRGGLRYFEQAHIKDVLAYLKILVNLKDESAWIRILKLYSGIGLATIKKIVEKIQTANSLQALFQQKISLNKKAEIAWQEIKQLFSYLLSLNQQEPGFISQALNYIIENHYQPYLEANYENSSDRKDDLQELVEFVGHYQDLDELLSDLMLDEHFSGETEQTAKEAIVLTTIHQAKGLEWPYVFIIGLRDGQFPHHQALDNPLELEEERRLFYVAVTRAQKELVMICPYKTNNFYYLGTTKKISRFIQELDQSKYISYLQDSLDKDF